MAKRDGDDELAPLLEHPGPFGPTSGGEGDVTRHLDGSSGEKHEGEVEEGELAGFLFRGYTHLFQVPNPRSPGPPGPPTTPLSKMDKLRLFFFLLTVPGWRIEPLFDPLTPPYKTENLLSAFWDEYLESIGAPPTPGRAKRVEEWRLGAWFLSAVAGRLREPMVTDKHKDLLAEASQTTAPGASLVLKRGSIVVRGSHMSRSSVDALDELLFAVPGSANLFSAVLSAWTSARPSVSPVFFCPIESSLGVKRPSVAEGGEGAAGGGGRVVPRPGQRADGVFLGIWGVKYAHDSRISTFHAECKHMWVGVRSILPDMGPVRILFCGEHTRIDVDGVLPEDAAREMDPKLEVAAARKKWANKVLERTRHEFRMVGGDVYSPMRQIVAKDRYTVFVVFAWDMDTFSVACDVMHRSRRLGRGTMGINRALFCPLDDDEEVEDLSPDDVSSRAVRFRFPSSVSTPSSPS